MAAPGAATRGLSWNPLRCGGTALPPHVLLAAKLIAVFFLTQLLERYGSEHAMPAGSLGPDLALTLGALLLLARAVAVVSAFLLLFNRLAPQASFALGLATVFSLARYRVDYSELFLGVFLILAAFQRNGREPFLLRFVVVANHVATGLVWLSGSGSAPLLDVLAGREKAANLSASDSYMALEAARPPGLLPQLTDWGMVLVSFGLAAAFLIRRCYAPAIWVVLLLHVVWSFLAGPAGALSYAVLAPYLVFVAWPREPLVVIYDGDCGFCNKTREWITRFDFDRLYDWRTFQSGAGASFGISQQALEEKAHVVAGGRIYAGFRAFRMMALYNPATSLGAAVAIAAAGFWAPVMGRWLFAALVVLFSPLFYPIGEAGYGWVSRNRHRLPPRTCKAPE